MHNQRTQSQCKALSMLLICLIVVTGLDIRAQQRTRSRRGTGTQKTSSQAHTLNDDAQREANKLLNMLFTKCGDSYYFYYYFYQPYGGTAVPLWVAEKPSDLRELKGVTIRLSPEQLSTADKLNGFEWSGNID